MSHRQMVSTPGLSNLTPSAAPRQKHATQEEVNLKELVKGTRGRSCDQWDIWQLVFGPRSADGYVKPIWDTILRRLRELAFLRKPSRFLEQSAQPKVPALAVDVCWIVVKVKR